MTSTDETRKTRPVRKRLWQYFLQFRLRTLLFMVTAAAIACWWYVTPKTIEDHEAGGHLLIRRDVLPHERVLPEQRGSYLSAQDWRLMYCSPFVFNVGSWELFGVSESGQDILVRGRYLKNKPHGVWTLYHANGNLAAQGRMERGARIGLWRNWSADGQIVSEVTYDQVPVTGYTGISPPVPTELYRSAVRQGPARTWHSNGKPQLAGAYLHDERYGPWKEYDEDGQVVAEGKFSAGQRVGSWRMRDASTGNYQEVVYPAARSR